MSSPFHVPPTLVGFAPQVFSLAVGLMGYERTFVAHTPQNAAFFTPKSAGAGRQISENQYYYTPPDYDKIFP
jgi:hypothetical protein